MPGQANSAAQPNAVEVRVVPAKSQEIIDYREFTGRTTAVDSVEIRPRVTGYLLQAPQSDAGHPGSQSGDLTSPNDHVPYHGVVAAERPADALAASDEKAAQNAKKFIVEAHEGDSVQAGEPLFEIDPEPYRLAYLQAAGQLEASEAKLIRARQQYERLKKLVGTDAITEEEFEIGVATLREAAGQIENLKAVVDRAYLDWQYTQVRSPIAGLLGRALMTKGNLAVADTTILATVVTTDPIYVYFDVDESSALDYRARVAEGQVKSARKSTIDVSMSLANESTFPHKGVIDFVDNTTNPQTGNTRIRARFENPQGILVPGLFAQVRAPFTAPHEAVLVPTVSLASDQQGRFVMVVDDQETAHRRVVTLGTQQGDQTVVRDGLQAGETVVVSGLQRVRNGAKVKIASESAKSVSSDQSHDRSTTTSGDAQKPEPAH